MPSRPLIEIQTPRKPQKRDISIKFRVSLTLRPLRQVVLSVESTRHLMTTCNDVRRIFRRDKNLGHLPKSASLPVLQPRTLDRPVFMCGRCGSANDCLPVCTRCAYPSDPMRENLESLPHKRRMSSPTVIDWAQPNAKDYQYLLRLPMLVHPSLREIRFYAPTPEMAIASDYHEAGGSETVAFSRSLRTPNEPCASVVRTTCLCVVPLHLPGRSLEDQRRYLPEQVSGDLGSSETHTILSSVDRAMTMMKLTKSSRSLSSHIIVDLTNVQSKTNAKDKPNKLCLIESHNKHTSPPSSPSHEHLHKRTLRRKKQMTILRQKSTTSLRARVRASAPPCPRADIPEVPHARPRPHSSMSEGAIPVVRLGHINRPYYSAIRKNMSLPNSPTGGPSSAYVPRSSSPDAFPAFAPRLRPQSLALSLDISTCDDDDAEDDNDLPFVLTPFSSISRGRTGQSMAREAELRMALGGGVRRHEHGSHSPDASSSGVKGKVRKLGKGLKDFVLGRR